ncbi:hypothetical protein PV08_07636 [Exophiala spinifera]|uniref:Fumarylacetoacetase-like C-terminal domain-containing protein n=1 Tax=Exophiala spinifera TaxID=91928 RepID=A0A0D1YIT4_9EURO|nr:uncharacterized protein PV08_07636 [Exophiala spinifera]KIW14851.1 hypothetical protein PV08_07636 [Exophiala spinifera]
MSFKRLVRFAHDGAARYGDLVEAINGSYKVRLLSGSVTSGFQPESEQVITVEKLLCPLEKTPIIQCIGLNYRKHAEEASLQVPPFPVVFTKPADALAGPDEEIPICPDAQKMLDFEGELTVVVGKDVKNLPEDFDLAEVVLGYTIGNDVSARNYQLPDVSGGQFCYAKSFDKFAPIGPWITSPTVIPDPHALSYTTKVNGETFQSTGTDDMIWSVKQILHHLSRGTTLRAGTVIMTGTPSGVGIFRKVFLKDGDVVEVEIAGEMKLVNTMKFE